MMLTQPGGLMHFLLALSPLPWLVACCDIWQSGPPLAINTALPRVDMASSHKRLLDIDDALVTEANPARNDGKLDVERCVRLHNYLAARAWMAKNRKGPEDLKELSERPSVFEQFENQDDEYSPEGIRNLLDPDMVKFLESAIYLGSDDNDPYLFIWVSTIAWLPEMVTSTPNIFDDQPEVNGKPHFITLYATNYEMGGHEIGVVYDQVRRQVSFPYVIEYLDFVQPVEEHQDVWFPLELMLSKWINLVHLGKVIPQPKVDDYSQSAWDVWNWKSYTASQVDSAVAAFDRLTAAIESRMPAGSLLPLESGSPLLTDAHLDAASIPQNSFVRSFLTKVRNPRFSTIAPGLEVPHDPVVFAQQQKFTIVPYRPGPNYGLGEIKYDPEDHVAPVLLFAATDKRRKVPLGRSYNYPFWHWLRIDNKPLELEAIDLRPQPQVEFGMNLRGLYNWWFNSAKYKQVPAGVYSEIVDRNNVGYAEEGFRLLLPYGFRFDYGSFGPRLSDGSLVDPRSSSELFQHGFQPFGGESHRAQRLERLLDRWRELVEQGVWRVGSTGVKGTIDTYKDAEWKNWENYWIPPDW